MADYEDHGKLRVVTGECTLSDGKGRGGENDPLKISIPKSTFAPTVYAYPQQAEGVNHISRPFPNVNVRHSEGLLELWLGSNDTGANWRLVVKYALIYP